MLHFVVRLCNLGYVPLSIPSETHVTWNTYIMRLWKLSMRLGPNFKELKFMDITTIPPIHLSSGSYGSTSKTNLDFEMELFFRRPLLCKGRLYKSRCVSVCVCVCACHFQFRVEISRHTKSLVNSTFWTFYEWLQFILQK